MTASINLADILSSLQTCFTGQSAIQFVVVFGSRARGDYTPTSDLDVGIMYESSPDLLTIGRDVSEIERLIPIQTDLIVLNGLPTHKPEFAYNLAKEMKLAYARDTSAFFEFKTLCFLSYFDFFPVIEQSRKLMQERIINGTYGRPVYAKQN